MTETALTQTGVMNTCKEVTMPLTEASTNAGGDRDRMEVEWGVRVKWGQSSVS